ncbi:TMF-regulated nuclear protein 1-like [Accipiter gentilis]|uniref:TMF-regulated nuclear protein 1-like n=1 Tax=Astur gentilis TaxID=8957 RepID=UPI00210F5FFB|nr:TMF-regulated nuclear protein 1-like [Accipiter gentilis]
MAPVSAPQPPYLFTPKCPDTRRKQKLLLTQLRVLRLLLGVIENPGPPSAPPPPPPLICPPSTHKTPPPKLLGEAGAQARRRWQELKEGYGGAVAALGGALPPTLAQLGRGRTLVPRLRGVLDTRLRQKEELEAKVREAVGRREQLRQRVEERRREQLSRQGALRRQEGAVQRAGAGCRLYQTLSGVRVLPPPPTPGCQEVELELGPPPGLPENFPTLRLCRSAGGGLRFLTPPPPLPPPLGPGLLELQGRCWEGRPLWAEVEQLQRRFALDWEPELGRLRVLGGPRGSETVWTLELEAGYPGRGGGVRLLPPPAGVPAISPPSASPTLTEWLELLVGTPK